MHYLWLFVVGWHVATRSPRGDYALLLRRSPLQRVIVAPVVAWHLSAVVPRYLEAIGFAPAYCSAVRGASNFNFSRRTEIVALAAGHQLPVMYDNRKYPQPGGS